MVESGQLELFPVTESIPTSPGASDTSSTPDSSPEGYIDEDTLRSMSDGDLKALITDNEIPVPTELLDDQEALVEWLIKEFGV